MHTKEKLEKDIMMENRDTHMSVSIKGLDENAYRNLKAEAIRHGMRVSEAATEAFRLWVASKRQTRQRDEERMHTLRNESKATWSGAEEIRRWRDERKR